MRRIPTLRTGLGLALTALLAVGCAAPEEDRPELQGLRRSMDAAVTRELARAPEKDPVKPLQRLTPAVFDELKERRAQLDATGPQVVVGGQGVDLGIDLYGEAFPETTLSLQDAIRLAVKNNLGVQGARLQQGVTQAELVAAQAAFDAAFVASTQGNLQNQPTQNFGGILPSDFSNHFKQWTLTSGIQTATVTGGSFNVGMASTYSKLYPENLYSNNPAWINAVQVGLTQPLLRGFGTDVNMAQIRLARNNDRRSLQQLRAQLLQLCRDVEQGYWALVLARQRVATAQWLVRVGVDVRDVLAKRRAFDTTQAQYADAVAKVEDRKSQLIRAQRDVTGAVDRLKVLLNDPSLPVGDETMIVPTDFMVDQPLRYSLREAISTAMEQSPTITQALLGVDDAGIRQVVADNGRLPELNLNAQMQFNGLEGDYGQSWQELGEAGFVNYLVGLNFNQPIGNRAGEANYRRARLQRSQAVLAYRGAVQTAIFQVKDSLRSVDAQFRLIEQTRAYRLAQAENLRALLVEEQTIATLTPEFLALKFQRQQELANAQVQEMQSLVEYSSAMAQLWHAMGTGLQMNRVEIGVADPAGPSL
jgi:outer membrane protein TolC